MKHRWFEMIRKNFILFIALVFMALFTACTEKLAGGTTEDAGLAIKDLDVAGVSQKGPFAKGSHVTVQGLDCQTMKLTNDRFEGEIKSDKGDFDVDGINLKSSCAVFEVSGHYLNEVTGKLSSEAVTLRALTDLDGRINVNVNLLTQLEYERVVKLVRDNEMPFALAKRQAEKEVLAAFSVEGNFAKFEDLNIFESGDGNAALLAVSVLMQVSNDSSKEVNIAERVNNLTTVIAEDGIWNDEVKTDIAEWATAAKENGQIDSVRKNLESLGYTNEIPAFEKYVEDFTERTILADDYDWSFDLSLSRDAYLNPDIKYDSIVDKRDGQVYKTVKIKNQVWMAQNLNYADSVNTPSLLKKSWCMNDDEASCSVLGRLYTLAAAIDSVKLATDASHPQICGYAQICTLPENVQGICPEGFHLPDTTEYRVLIDAVGGEQKASQVLKARIGWYNDFEVSDFNGTDDYGFSAVSSGDRYRSGIYTFDGRYASFVTTSDVLEEDGRSAYFMGFAAGGVSFGYSFKDNGLSVRCVKD